MSSDLYKKFIGSYPGYEKKKEVKNDSKDMYLKVVDGKIVGYDSFK